MKSYIAPRKLSEQVFRHELKYAIPLAQANKLMDELKFHCDVDKHADSTESYEIASTYYDTPDLRFYFDREESVGYRRKIRLRSYNTDSEAKALFIEIKERHKQVISKKRINLRDMSLLSNGITHDKLPLNLVVEKLEDGAEAREMAYLAKRLNLNPIVIVRYVRKPLIPRIEDTMRITLDTRITAGGASLPEYDRENETFLLPPDFGIFEVKTNQSVPVWLQSVLRRYDLTQTRFSKYCLAVDAVYGSGRKYLLSAKDSRQIEADEAARRVALG